MAEANRYEGEIHLPETIIQHIQSLLTAKEAAGTTLLSKSWYTAWLTRPNLDFDFRDGRFGTDLAFFTFVEKTIERYKRLNLKVESFRLWIRDARHEEFELELGKCNRYLFASELITGAMKLGATDLEIEIDAEDYWLSLPLEVFGSENLVRLSVSGVKGSLIYHTKKVSCSKLKSLNLRNVCIVGPLIWDICSSCPLIEELSFSECSLAFENSSMPLIVRALPLSPFFKHEARINPWYEFHKLKRLFLEKLDFCSSFFHDFSSKFPCLDYLALHDCGGFKSMQISSPSLERLSIVGVNLRWANLDFLNIRWFAFSGSKFPCLCFNAPPNSGEWESHITYTSRYSWFTGLKSFLKRLSSSKITLSLKFLRSNGVEGLHLFPCDFIPQSLPQPWVENLMLSVDEPSSELLFGLFWSCRPKFITAYPSISCTKFLWSILAQERSEDCCISDKYRPYFDDLVEVNVEIFEESLAEWVRVALDASINLICTRKMGFRLKWGQEEPSTST